MIGIPMLLGPALGPILSGWLLEFADWRLIFLINVPVGALALLVAARALPALAASHRAAALDTLGVVLGPLAFASLSYGISESTTAGWTGAPTLIGIGIGVIALAAFVARELTAKHPLLELRVFRSRDFTLGILTQWAGFAGLFGTMFLVPVFLQQVRGYGPFETGFYTLPQAVFAAIFMPVGGRIFDRFGARVSVLPGLVLVASAQWMLAEITSGSLGVDMRLALAMQGAGMALMLMPLGTHILNSAPRQFVTRVTSLTGALQSVVASLAIATWATLLQSRVPAHIADLAGGQRPTPELMRSAFALALGDVYHTSLLVVATAFLIALTLRRRPGVATSHEGPVLAEPAIA
jgi:EmrB/QacA subfamily drug resistance transporter